MSTSEDGDRRRQRRRLGMVADDVKPLFGENSDTAKTQMTSSNPFSSSPSAAAAAAAIMWNFDERRRLGVHQSDISRYQDNVPHFGRLGNVRRWPSVKPLDLSVTSRTVVTPRDALKCSDLRSRLQESHRTATRYVCVSCICNLVMISSVFQRQILKSLANLCQISNTGNA